MTDTASKPGPQDPPVSGKPEGPIWVDISPTLFETASMSQVLAIANLAMNRLSMRDWGEILGEVGLRPEISFRDAGKPST